MSLNLDDLSFVPGLENSRRVLRPMPQSGLLGWPCDWDVRRYNACNEPCDMLIGPCACGAWHKATELWVKEVLEFYDAVIEFHI